MAESVIQCTLVENALDYLLLAGEQVQVDSARMLKHALATLSDGVELLLKARLEIHDWRQLFQHPDKADRKKYERGEFTSASMDDAIARLRDLASIRFEDDARSLLAQLKVVRNRIRHFAVSITRKAALSLVVRSYSFAIDFYSTEIERHYFRQTVGELRTLTLLGRLPEATDEEKRLQQTLQGLAATIRKMLSQFAVFVDARLKELRPVLEDQGRQPFVQCPMCLQAALSPDGGIAECVFCGYRCDGERAASEWFARRFAYLEPKERLGLDIIKTCADCGAAACVPMGQEFDDSSPHVCLSCGLYGTFERCVECGSMVLGEAFAGRCHRCWEDRQT
jgi:hypothetical protein